MLEEKKRIKRSCLPKTDAHLLFKRQRRLGGTKGSVFNYIYGKRKRQEMERCLERDGKGRLC